MLEEIPSLAFVVDTESYSGNFERQMCGYITGVIGECEVGSEEAAEFNNEHPGQNPFDDIVMQVPDEHGCRRPVAIWPTPGWFNNSMGGHFRDGDLSTAQKHYRASCLEEAQERPYADDGNNKRHEAECRARAEEQVTECPAYQSVAIFFGEEPNENLIATLKKRAQDFCKREKITLTGFRILEFKLQIKEKSLV